jgi:uncharacterized phage protein (TIGR02220 family)
LAENQRDFKGVWIPKAIWLDSRLTALDKVILTEIDSLDQGERGCYASNKHIADFCQCSEAKVTKSISHLTKLGYVYVQKFDGRQRELRSRLVNFTRQDNKKCESESENLLQSNTENNTSINTDIKDIVAYLNEKVGSSFRDTSKATQRVIKARLSEGFTVGDFFLVIDKKTKEWKGDSKMEQYLRPETLFGTKFEGYLNARVSTPTDKTIPASIRNRVSDVDDW